MKKFPMSALGATLICALTIIPRLAAQESAPSVSPARPVTVPRSDRIVIHSKVLQRTYDLYVKVPSAYDAPDRAASRYPTVYLTDAPEMFQITAAVTHRPMDAKVMEDIIIVGIGYSYDNVENESRRRDYTPTADPAFGRATGEAARFTSFLVTEAIPLIESSYRVDRSRRTYAGHSFGGLYGAYLLFNNPNLFSSYILISPSFWYDNHVTWRYEVEYGKEHRDLRASIYVAIGSLEHPNRHGGGRYEMVQDVRTFESKLKGRDYSSLRIITSVVDGATHETVVPAAMMNGMLWLFAKDRRVPYRY